jgi:multidrug resistance efflux pump
MGRRLAALAFAGTLLAGGAPTDASPAGATAGWSRLVAPPGAETELRPRATLPIARLVADLDRPLAAGALLVELDTGELERQLAAAQYRLESLQTRKRNRGSAGEGGGTAGRAGGRGASAPQGPGSLEGAEEMAALGAVASLQGRIVDAPLRAPAAGYVVRYLQRAGERTRKRTPLALFVAAARTRLELELPAAAAATLRIDEVVRVTAAVEPSRSFRARIARAAPPAGGTVALVLAPLELPFLSLGEPAPVVLVPAR